MTTRFHDRYREGRPPWDLGRPDANLVRMVVERLIPPGRALDIGCGTGDNAIWLARQGFEVTGVDVVEDAVRQAESKAADAGVRVALGVGDFLVDPVSEGPYDLAFDRGCFHSFAEGKDRTRFAERVRGLLVPGGLWITITGNLDDPPRDHGPPMRSAAEIVVSVEPSFEILSLTASRFDSNRESPPRAWVGLFRRRGRVTE